MKVKERTPYRLVLRHVTLWLWVMTAWAIVVAARESLEFAVRCERDTSSGGSCYSERVHVIPTSRWSSPIPIQDIERVVVEKGDVVIELTGGERAHLPNFGRGLTSEEIAARLNAFLQDRQATSVHIIRSLPARLGISPLGPVFIVVLIALFVATLSDLVITCTADKELGKVMVRRRGLLWAREAVIPLRDIADVEVQHGKKGRNARVCFILKSGERKPLRPVYMPGNHEATAQHLREFLGLPQDSST
jgi:hypothetical protein